MKKLINASCKRDGEKFNIKIENAGQEYDLYYTEEADVNAKATKLLTSTDGEMIIEDPIKGKRTYFIVKMNGYENEIFAERKLPLKGCCNFRDLGGIKTSDNRRVKWDKFYRADALNNLTAEDLNYLSSVGLKLILDYRGQTEASSDKDVEIKGAEYVNIPAMAIEDDNNTKTENEKFNIEFLIKNADKVKGLNNPIEFMVNGYKAMPFNNEAYKKLMNALVIGDIPLVQHCTSGKDRTGVGAALVLMLLGVSLEDVKKDYLASNFYRKQYNESVKQKFSALITSKEVDDLFSLMLDVREEYFDAVISSIKAKYDSIEGYFKAEFNLDDTEIIKLKNKYLY